MTEQLFLENAVWQKETFGQSTPLSKLAHLEEEVRELASDIATNNPERRLEYADCFLLLFGCAAADGMTYQDVCNAIKEKLTINQTRTWGVPDKNGVIKHV
jgi:NTP pyrophosphatase (non-canonical NTP hydrolase)